MWSFFLHFPLHWADDDEDDDDDDEVEDDDAAAARIKMQPGSRCNQDQDVTGIKT